MKTKFTRNELFAIEELSNRAKGQFAKDINLKVRKGLGLSLPLSEDNGVNNVTRNIAKEVLATKERDEVVLDKKWLNFLARSVKKFLNGNGFTADEALVKLLGSGNAKEFYAKYPTAKYYEELYAAIQTWLTMPVPPTRINVIDFLLSIVVAVLQFIDGRFGKIVLKRKFRICWRVVTYSLVAIFLWTFVITPFFDAWDRVVNLMNYVIWGTR